MTATPIRSITLSPQEQGILATLTRQELSAFAFWQGVLVARDIKCPSDRIPVTSPLGNGIYRLEWHTKRLGPQALAEGQKYRAFHAKKDQEFASRLQRQGKGVW